MSAPFFASVGLGSMVCANRVLAVIAPGSRTAKSYTRLARKAGTLMDVTMGKTCKSIVVFDNGYLLLSHITTSTLRYRFSNLQKPKPWRSSEERREEELGEDDVSVLLEDDEEEDEEEPEEFGPDTDDEDEEEL